MPCCARPAARCRTQCPISPDQSPAGRSRRAAHAQYPAADRKMHRRWGTQTVNARFVRTGAGFARSIPIVHRQGEHGLIAVWCYARSNEAHVPAISIVAIDSNDGAVLFVERATWPWNIDREAVYPVATVALNMYFQNLNRVASRARREALDVVVPDGVAAAHDDWPAISALRRPHRLTPYRPGPWRHCDGFFAKRMAWHCRAAPVS